MRTILPLCLFLALTSCGTDREVDHDWVLSEDAPRPLGESPESDPTDEVGADDDAATDPLEDHEFPAASYADGVAAAEEYCDAYAEIYCNYVWQCLSVEQRAGVALTSTNEHCVALHSSFGCSLEESAENGNVQVDADGLRECVRAARAGDCFDVWGCAWKAIRPTVGRGEACTSNLDCMGDDACRFAESDVCSVRVCRPLAEEGEFCAFGGECQSWLSCVDEVCVAPGSEDTFCDAEHPCDEGLECITGAALWGYCVRYLGQGEACLDGPLNCDPREAYCDFEQQPDTPYCRPFAAPGASCEDADCDYHHFCSAAAVCEPIVAPGAPCAEDAACWYDHACVDGICSLVGTVGSACEWGLDCHEWLECIGGVCTYALDDGESCVAGGCRLTSDCVDGVCVDYHEQCATEGMP